MTSPRQDSQGFEGLREATAARARVTLHVRTGTGSMLCRSRFAGDNRQDGGITVEYPVDLQADEVAPAIGQLIGVSVWGGTRRFAFESDLIARTPARAGRVETLTLSPPQDIQESQRRLYSRTCVPDEVMIPVNVTPVGLVGAARAGGVPSRGILLDLSAGGMSMTLPADRNNRWRCGDGMTCLVALEPAREPREVSGCVRHVDRAAHGHLRLGIEFVGLESSPAGQETLRQITRASCRLRRAAGRRAGRL